MCIPRFLDLCNDLNATCGYPLKGGDCDRIKMSHLVPHSTTRLFHHATIDVILAAMSSRAI
jgi:hypothetical protein